VGGQVTKSIIGRARPYTGRGSHFFKVFTFNDDFHSFPSGHTTAAFTVSAVLAARIDNPWATAGLYGLAASTALSRIYSNNHWFSDVVFGGLAASAVGRTLVSTFERNEPEPTGFQIIPQPTGISLVYRF
jgi:membrane-associated phospholipid phosphatase